MGGGLQRLWVAYTREGKFFFFFFCHQKGFTNLIVHIYSSIKKVFIMIRLQCHDYKNIFDLWGQVSKNDCESGREII